MGKHETLTGAQRLARHRAAMRARGLRLKQFWVPDLRDPKVREALRADAEALARQAHKWDDFWIEMEALQADLWDSEPAPAYHDPDETESNGQ